MLTLPRAARLACWANAWLSGNTSLDEADEHIRGDDAAHHVLGFEGEDEPMTMLFALGRLRRLGTQAALVALPAPGDPLGLAGPREFNEAALEVGEAVLCAGVDLGLVPDVVGAGVQWRVYAANVPPPLQFADATAELAHTLLEVTQSLAGLDVAQWRPEVAEALASLRKVGRRSDDGLAPGYPSRADELAARARKCLLVCEIALADDGGSTTAYEADTRRRALRHLEYAARRALVAACTPSQVAR